MKKLIVILLLSTVYFSGCVQQMEQELSSDIITKEEQEALTPDQILQSLKEGNRRFVEGKLTPRNYNKQVAATANEQHPKAIILSCLDSRVPVEIVFDEGIGDVFVGRVAGNIENEDMLGSFEFGTKLAGAKLILVLGHSNCGAVKGAVDYEAVEKLGMNNLNTLLEGINPAVEAVLNPDEKRNSKNLSLVERAVEKNVLLTIQRILEKSETLHKMEKDGDIKIVGGVYDLATGEVHWL